MLYKLGVVSDIFLPERGGCQQTVSLSTNTNSPRPSYRPTTTARECTRARTYARTLTHYRRPAGSGAAARRQFPLVAWWDSRRDAARAENHKCQIGGAKQFNIARVVNRRRERLMRSSRAAHARTHARTGGRTPASAPSTVHKCCASGST